MISVQNKYYSVYRVPLKLLSTKITIKKVLTYRENHYNGQYPIGTIYYYSKHHHTRNYLNNLHYTAPKHK